MGKKQIVINKGDAQPVPCSYCNSKEGYQVVDNIRTTYTTAYYPNGGFEQGWYGEGLTSTKKGLIAFCSNCGIKLKFKVKSATTLKEE